jgi:hypothetical protein
VDPADGQIEDGNRVEDTPLGGREFKGAVEHRDPLAPQLTPAPEGIPEKFWDPIKGELRTTDLIKSYGELEKKFAAPKADDEEVEKVDDDAAPDGDGEGENEPEGEQSDDNENEADGDDDAALAPVIEAAAQVYAETGDLPAEAREPLLKAGITNEQIDFYLAGVKATEAALQNAAATAAGSPEELEAAMKWAATEDSGWSDKKRIAFNAQMGDPDTIKLAVPGLMAEYRAANKGEGRLQNINSGVNRGDVYESMEEFRQELRKADDLRDGVARRKALDKLRRSRKAGTVKSNRRQPFGGRG